MTYEQRRKDLAEKMAETFIGDGNDTRKLHELSEIEKEAIYNTVFPIANIVLAEMAEVANDAYIKGAEDMYISSGELYSKSDSATYIISQGLIPQNKEG